MHRVFLIGCLLGSFLAGTAGCGKDEKPTGPAVPRGRTLQKPPGVDKKKEQGQKP